MDTTMTLEELRRRNVEIDAHEAVAIAQKLICEPGSNEDAHAPYGPLSLDTIAIDGDGTVHCRRTAATPSALEVGIVLEGLLAEGMSDVPGELRYLVSRALLEVEAPPFDSLQEFSADIERFEQGNRTAVIASLYQRAARSDPDRDSHYPASGTRRERRHHGSSAAELRRELREADLRLYAAQSETRGRGRAGQSGRATMRAPMVACVLAGVALIAAGELTQSRHGAAPPKEAPAPPSPATASASASLFGPMQPAADSRRPTITTPRRERSVISSDRSVRTSDRLAGGARTSAARDRNSAKAVRQQLQSRKTRQPKVTERSDQGVLARVRFEWGNPFGH
jgi:hypothetical protein